VLAYLCKVAEQLQLPYNCTASSADLSLAEYAEVAAAHSIPQIVEPSEDDLWQEGFYDTSIRAKATRAVGILASSAAGRQAIAATDGWSQVVAAVWNDVSWKEDDYDEEDDEDAVAALLSCPVTHILLATARAAAAAGEGPPFLQHLLRELKRLQENPELAEDRDPVNSEVHAHYRWLICQCCSIAGSCRVGLLAIAPLRPLLVQLQQQLNPKDAAVMEGVLAAANAAVQEVRGELQQAQDEVQQACRDAAAAHVPRRAVVQQVALFDACLQCLAAREARASELEEQLLRATACVDSVLAVEG
jgi:hypothetical protein